MCPPRTTILRNINFIFRTYNFLFHICAYVIPWHTVYPRGGRTLGNSGNGRKCQVIYTESEKSILQNFSYDICEIESTGKSLFWQTHHIGSICVCTFSDTCSCWGAKQFIKIQEKKKADSSLFMALSTYPEILISDIVMWWIK